MKYEKGSKIFINTLRGIHYGLAFADCVASSCTSFGLGLQKHWATGPEARSRLSFQELSFASHPISV